MKKHSPRPSCTDGEATNPGPWQQKRGPRSEEAEERRRTRNSTAALLAKTRDLLSEAGFFERAKAREKDHKKPAKVNRPHQQTARETRALRKRWTRATAQAKKRLARSRKKLSQASRQERRMCRKSALQKKAQRMNLRGKKVASKNKQTKVKGQNLQGKGIVPQSRHEYQHQVQRSKCQCKKQRR